jgi:hypothetical protein
MAGLPPPVQQPNSSTRLGFSTQPYEVIFDRILISNILDFFPERSRMPSLFFQHTSKILPIDLHLNSARQHEKMLLLGLVGNE